MTDQPVPFLSLVVIPTATASTRLVDSVKVRDTQCELLHADGGVTRSEGVNQALADATGEFVAIVSAADRMHPDAVSLLVAQLESDSAVDMAYTDQLVDGQLLLKPAFSPERLRCQFYMGSLIVYRRSLLNQLGGLRTDVEGAELYELALRMSRHARSVVHLPQPLIDTGTQNASDDEAGLSSIRRVLVEHLDATGGGDVLELTPTVYDTRRPVEGEPLVSIVIPTRGDSALVGGVLRCMVVEAVRSAVEKSTYKNVEFVIVVDEVTPPEVIEQLRRIAGDRVRFVPWEGPFSFSGKMNLGVVHTTGDYLLFLNDDTEVISPGWITAMLALAQRPAAGIVGSMLYFEDGTIQHAGHAYYRADVTHIGLHSERGASGPADAFLVEREVNGVTAACALMPRSVFFEVGGFSTLLPGNFNDVDLCMKIAAKGYQAYWTPHAELYHFESQSRDPEVAAYEMERAWGRWEHALWDSAYWPDNPHLTYKAESTSL